MASLYAWDHPVDDRLQTIADKLAQPENEDFQKTQVPGLKGLLDDYIADIDRSDDSKQVDYINFHRRLLKVFKDSKDETYQDLLQKHSEDERRRLDNFVEGADPNEVCKGFEMGPSLGCREHLEKLVKSQTAVKVSSTGVVDIKWEKDGSTNGVDGSWFHQQVQKIKELFHPSDDGHILVGYSPIDRPVKAKQCKVVSGQEVPKLGP